jgi:thiamine biosynthesis lipoprotein
MSTRRLNRRRVLSIFAAAAGSALVGGPSRSEVDFAWRGIAMGADAQILFSGIGEEDARATIAMAVAEIERLEQALSLFREDSEIRRLNHSGALDAPSGDMRRALALALDVAAASAGRFDPTVQALWEVHVDWFNARPDGGLPPDPAIESARAKVDWRGIALSADMIRLGGGQRITLNGLGQGYVTDRVADLLRARGLEHVLVDLGEQRALGPRADGTPWWVGRSFGDPIPLSNGALATSEGAGCILGAGGAAHHLFDPHTGRSASHWRRIIVHHASAAVADALSTTLYAASHDEIGAVLARFPGTTVWATDAQGREHRLASPVDPNAQDHRPRA